MVFLYFSLSCSPREGFGGVYLSWYDLDSIGICGAMVFFLATRALDAMIISGGGFWVDTGNIILI